MPVDLQMRELIARGAQGSVLLVWDRSQGRFLALKLVEVSGGEAAVERLLADLGRYPSGDPDPPGALVDFGNALHAPAGVASAFPTLAGGRRIWILMFYIHGPNARELAEGDPAFGPTEVAALLAQVATRLRGLEPGRAHLDLKPENLLVDRPGRAHVVDFHMGTTEGTTGFNAPEQRGEGGTPGPASDLYALGKIGAWLLARKFPKESDDPELFPQLPEPAADLPAERRRNIKELGQLLRALCHPDPAKRGKIEDVAKRLIEIAAALGGPDLQAPLAASMARAKLPERLERLGVALAKEPQRTTGNPLPQRGSGVEARKSIDKRIAIAFAILLFLLSSLFAWNRHSQQSLAANPPPAPANTSAHCKVSPPARLLAPLEAAGPAHALFQETVVEPAGRVTLKVLHGPEVFSLDAPQVGDDCKIDLPPGLYRWDEIYPNGKPEGDTVLLVAGGNERNKTHPYVHSAPMDPNLRDIFLMLNPENGPTVLFRGPLLLRTALWDATAGAVVIAPHGSRCRGPTRPLPPPSGNPGTGVYDPTWPQLESSEDLCALPTVNAPAGFALHVEVTLQPRPLPKAVDPAKRFVLDRTIKAKEANPLLLQGPLVLTLGSWDESDGLVGVTDGRCHDNLNVISPGTADFPDEVEKGRSVCAVPDSIHPGGKLTVHLEGYRP